MCYLTELNDLQEWTAYNNFLWPHLLAQCAENKGIHQNVLHINLEFGSGDTFAFAKFSNAPTPQKVEQDEVQKIAQEESPARHLSV